MTDNVIFPKRFARTTPREGGQQSGELRQRADAERHQRSIVRLREIESAAGRNPGVGKKGHIFGTMADRNAAGREVGLLVRRAKERGISVERIKLALGDRGTGTTRLDRYMLGSDIGPALAAEKGRKLQQRVSGYLAAAEAVATLTGEDADELKIRVLMGTSLWSQASAAQTEDDPRASYLAAELIEMGRAVVRRADLTRLFARARRVPGMWDIAAEIFRPFTEPSLYEEPYLDWQRRWDDAPPLPSVPLVRRIHATFRTLVRIETDGRVEPLRGEAATADDFEGSNEAAFFEVAREIRLALGPTTSADNIGPMLESRGHVALRLAEPLREIHDLIPDSSLETIDGFWSGCLLTFQVLIDGFWHRASMTESLTESDAKLLGGGDSPIYWPIEPFVPGSWGVESWCVSWSAINSESVKYWLDRPWGADDTKVVAPGDGERDERPIWYSAGTGLQIERALATDGLKEALQGAVQHIGEMLDQREAQWRAEAEAAHVARMMRWQEET